MLIAEGVIAAYWFATGHAAVARTHLILPTAVLSGAWLLSVAASGGYDARFFGVGIEEFRRVAHAAVNLTAAVVFIDYAAKLNLARSVGLGAIPLAASLSLAGRFANRKLLHRLRVNGMCHHRVVVIGRLEQVNDLIARLTEDRYIGMDVVAACVPAHQLPDARSLLPVPVPGPLEQAADIAESFNSDTVAVSACPELAGPALRRLSWTLERAAIDLLVGPGLVEVAGPRLHIRPLPGMPLLHVEHPTFSGGRVLLKGAVDRSCALALLVILSPALVTIALLVRLTTPGPALFKQTRVGANGRPFRVLKFRTMVQNAEALRDQISELNIRSEGLLFKVPDDPRVTPVGRWLRRYSLDELPQLINVLRGQMSLVGPRPPLPEEVERYAGDTHRRLLVKPGLTGLWQVSGRSNLTWEESIRLDLRYVENWSLTLDALILWKTLGAVFRGVGAY